MDVPDLKDSLSAISPLPLPAPLLLHTLHPPNLPPRPPTFAPSNVTRIVLVKYLRLGREPACESASGDRARQL